LPGWSGEGRWETDVRGTSGERAGKIVGPSGKGGRRRGKERDKEKGGRKTPAVAAKVRGMEELTTKEGGGKQWLVKVVGEVQGVKGVFLVDSGATVQFMDKRFAEKVGLKANRSKTRIKLADGVVSRSLGSVNGVQFLVGLKRGREGRGKKYSSRFELTSLSGYDAILGMSWMKEAKPRFIWDREVVGIEVATRTVNGRKRFKELQLVEESGSIEEQVSSIGKERGAESMVEAEGMARMRRAKRRDEEEEMEQVARPRSAEEQAVVARLMKEFVDVFPAELPKGLPPKRPGLEHRIKLKSHTKVPYRRPYRSGPAELKLVQDTIRELEAKGFIQRSQSKYGAPVLFTPKKDGTSRMVIDFREINKITVRNGYPLPATEELFPVVQGSNYFSKIDLHSGYYQIRIAEGDREKTAFVTRYGSYEFLVLPMGLCNSPGTFMELMNYVFEKQLDKFVIVFLDDVLVFSKDLKEHERHMRDVLQILRENRLYAKGEKCDLVRREVDFLGHRLGADGLAKEVSKTEAIEKWPQPKSKSEVRQFLGLAGYYRKFVKGFSEIAQPLTRLTGSTVQFQWEEREERSFSELKRVLVEEVVLALPDSTKPFVINTDASEHALGAVLQQDQGDGLRPIGFMSKMISGSQKNYPVHELEMLAIVEACEHWRHLIRGQKVTVRSDHHSLQYFFKQSSLSKQQVRWMEGLSQFDITIEYVKGKNNGVADAMSRKGQREREDEGATHTFQSLGWNEEAGAVGAAVSVMSADQSGRGEEVESSTEVVEEVAARRVVRWGGRKQVMSQVEEKQDRERCIRMATENLEQEVGQPAPNAAGAVVMPTQRCTASTARGGRCKGRTAKGQYCWTHLRKQQGLRIKQSTLGRRAGMGLFAERGFVKDEVISLYTGDWAWEDSSHTYVLELTRDRIIDAARTNAAPGRWANDPRGSENRANARFSYNARTQVAMVKATRPIAKGEEVFVPYGAQYWRGERGARVQLNGVTAVDLVAELLKECELDPEYKLRRQQLGEKAEVGAKAMGGFVWRGDKICVPATERARTLVLHECHDAPTGGHLGRDKTAAAVKLRFTWKGIDQWVEDYVTSCVKCQQNKPSNQKPAGELMPLPIPVRPWQQMGIDFIGPLPKTKSGMDGIAMMVCRFSKMKHPVAINMKMSAPEAVDLVVKEVVRLHGVPEAIVSDRDVRFTASFWKQFWDVWNTKLNMSTAYHPQTDGQSERENRTLVEAVRSFVQGDEADWDKQLPMLELAMNGAKQSSTGMSPFMMVYGREAVLPMDVAFRTPITTSANPAAGELHQQLEEVWKRATTSLEKAQARQKKAADLKRRAVEYQVGDKVLLSTAEIKLIGTKELNRSVKFESKFIGPFVISEVKNRNAYRLELPDKFKIHPVVNISRLKKWNDGSDQFPSREVEEWRPSGEVVRDANGELEWEVERILAEKGGARKKHYLVKWKGYPMWESTWEREENLENAKAEMRKFRQRVVAREKEAEEQMAAMSAEPLVGTFKGVESVTVQKAAQHGDDEFNRVQRLVEESGVSVANVMKHLIEAL
jgi:hypothetical protein